jgi:hypothetical protein
LADNGKEETMASNPSFDFDAEAPPPTPNLPIPRETLESMERNRAKALLLMTAAFDQLEEGRRLAGLAAGSFAESGTNVNTVTLAVKKPA